jgi:type IV secretory pathway VirB10-like protein
VCLDHEAVVTEDRILLKRTVRPEDESSCLELQGAAGREVSQLGTQITRKNLNVQRTVKIPAGYKFTVRVNRDILFEEAYQPVQPLQSDALTGGSQK